MLDDLRALVEFAQAGSIAGAADRLFRTPSAITRQVQRLEAALGAELLDDAEPHGLLPKSMVLAEAQCGIRLVRGREKDFPALGGLPQTIRHADAHKHAAVRTITRFTEGFALPRAATWPQPCFAGRVLRESRSAGR